MTARPPLGAALALCLVSARSLEALHPATRLYSPRDGLPQSRVTAVCQDAEGFLWIGTQRGGLARYDGQSWRVLDTADGLPSNDVRWLTRWPDGTILVATTGGFGRIRAGRFERLGPQAAAGDGLVRTLEASSPGRVWVGQRSGLALWTEGGPERRLILARDGRVADVEGLASDGVGGVYAATSLGLAHVSASAQMTSSWVSGLPAGEAAVVVRRHDGSLAVGVTGSGVFVGQPAAFTRVGDDAAPGLRVISLLDDANGGLLAGTSGQGAFRCRERCQQLVGQDLEPDAMVFDLFKDREGVLWFATDAGLGKRVASLFESYDVSDGFPQTTWVYGMAETRDGSLWVATSKGTVVRLRSGAAARAYGEVDGLPPSLVSDVLATRGGEGLLVCTRRGLFRRVGERFVRERLAVGVPDDLNAGLDSRDGLYLASWNEGLYLQRGGTAWRVPPPVGPVVEALAPLRDGRVWCGGAGFGIVLLDAGRVVSQLTTREGLPSDHVNGIFEDSKGNVWVATQAGAWCRRPDGTQLRIDRASGLPGNFVYWVVETADGAHWLGTNQGVVRRSLEGRLERFTVRDGLARNECSPDGAFVASDGRLFVGNSTLSVARRRPPPPAALPLAYVEAGPDGLQPAGSPVRVGSGSGPLRFRFMSPSFVDEQATYFRTRLVGLSEQWQLGEPGEGTATYGGLAPGAYRFEVEAVASDGRVSPAPARLSLIVVPRWWQRRDVHAVGLALAAILGILGLRVRERWHASAAAQLQRLVDERTDALRGANARLESLAATDELTGVANRRSAMERLGQAIASARRHGSALSIALVDLDGFKGVNDALGHPLGDDCLKWVAARLADAMRAGDHLGRLGGDEFLAVFVATDLEGARRAAARMAAALAARPWQPPETSASGLPEITLSIGVAALGAADPDSDGLLLRADRALYAAKRAGRARIVAAE